MSTIVVEPEASISETSETPVVARGNTLQVFRNRAIDSYVDQAAQDHPLKPAIIDRFGSLTWSEVEHLSRRLATGLEGLGVKPGDRVAVQLPNWRHFPLLEYALSRLGAICVPLPAIYRERELKFMLDLVAPVVAVVPSRFRNFDHAAMMTVLQTMLPSLRSLVIVGEPTLPGHIAFDALLAEEPFMGSGRTDPDAVTEIVFTSGTTGEPKGVMHSANTNLCPLFSLIDEQQLTCDEVILMASTFGHQTGFVYGGQLPAVLGATLVLLDQWDVHVGSELIEREKVTWTMGATPFLQDLVEYASADTLASLRTFLCSGASIPPSLLGAARARTNASIASGWGMTEVGLVTLSKHGDNDERIASSDGMAFECMAIRLTDEQGNPVGADQEGNLWCRGPSMFLGYYRRPRFTSDGFGADGWFRTGDRGRVDESGYLRIVGRTKDIIIRGGENIPVIEVEDLLRQHAAVERVALVAVPDPRLQERACAVVVLRPAQQFTFDDMRSHLLQFKLAHQYIPEHLVVVTELPMTPSGKVQKYVLRDQITSRLGQMKGNHHARGS
jgi:cyclohexanecarboxylate-CoA ligase